MKVAVVRYNAGNIRSVINALRRIGVEPVVTDDAAELASADRVIFPGQGEAANTMAYLRESGLGEVIRGLKQPVLGICIGMQLMCRHSAEGNTDCLGIFDTDVVRFCTEDKSLKIPQMGWNTICDTRSKLFDGLNTGDGMFDNPYVYFIHSYYVPLNPHTIAVTDYCQPYSSALHKDNFYATQFHPEKSGEVGEKILRNFIDIVR